MNVTKIKLGAILALVVLGAIIFLQNTGSVEIKLLFFTLIMPRAVLLIATTLFGIAIGILYSFMWLRKKEKRAEKLPVKKEPQPPPAPAAKSSAGTEMTDPQI